ncbi:hypothetical protein DL765_002369 [Monosporascus sp. GIB2]|nr:hypothetical protein DL765_002369 [Monosporascus sp. GIB2]
MADLPSEIASTIQAGHIKRDPSPRHDLNPSTSASERQPVSLQRAHKQHRQRRRQATRTYSGSEADGEGDDDDVEDGDDDDEIPVSVLKPQPRGHHRAHSFPPMPDLRFEQSYLHSIAGADKWWKVAWITVRDQMMMPLAQGVLYNLAICGWQHWNRNARIHGNSVGARVRRWWYGVNSWALPPREPGKAAFSKASLAGGRR